MEQTQGKASQFFEDIIELEKHYKDFLNKWGLTDSDLHKLLKENETEVLN